MKPICYSNVCKSWWGTRLEASGPSHVWTAVQRTLLEVSSTGLSSRRLCIVERVWWTPRNKLEDWTTTSWRWLLLYEIASPWGVVHQRKQDHTPNTKPKVTSQSKHGSTPSFQDEWIFKLNWCSCCKCVIHQSSPCALAESVFQFYQLTKRSFMGHIFSSLKLFQAHIKLRHGDWSLHQLHSQ